jgi:hypothetical protein
VYIVGGCNPSQPTYRGYIYTILISAWVLQQCGSQADIIVYIQLSSTVADTVLPEQDIRPMQQLGIHIRYMNKTAQESFHRIILEKLLIVVGLTQYARVIFLDGDVLVRRNLDYLFELSMKVVLKDNLIVRGRGSPANAGLFMLTPEEGGYAAMQTILHDTEERGRHMPYPPHWDETVGWGHVIAPDDPWRTTSTLQGTLWNYYGAQSDQGLLYYWVKYVKKSFSVIVDRSVENWGPIVVEVNGRAQERAQLQSKMRIKDLAKFVNVSHCHAGMTHMRSHLSSDFIHYMGRTNKPWMRSVPEGLSEATSLSGWIHYWFWMLMKVNDALELQIDFSNWTSLGKPLLDGDPEMPKLT